MKMFTRLSPRPFGFAGYDATTTRDQHRLGAEDPDQLVYIQQQNYTLLRLRSLGKLL